MKKINLIILTFILSINCVNSQNDTMYIMKQGNVIYRHATAEIDSIIFYNPDLTEELYFVSLSSDVYYCLHYKYYTLNQILIQELSGDGAVLTANGGQWFDDGRYQRLHLHIPNADERILMESWNAWFSGIHEINKILPVFYDAPESQSKKRAISEMKVMRAFFYFLIQDMWGGVPIFTVYDPDNTPKARDTREDVCKFIEDEILEALPDLTVETGAITYSRPTKWMAYSLLAKLYMNWEVYTGKPGKWNEAVTACDAIITEAQTNGTFCLEPDYLRMFYPDNGPHIKEFIFTIPCDAELMRQHYPARYWLHPQHGIKYSLPYTPFGCIKTWPEYYNKFTVSGDNDVRKQQWLTGKQYFQDGSPIIIITTNTGLDNLYVGPDPNAIVYYHLELTSDIVFRNTSFDTGNDQLGRAVGYRNNKFYPDSTSSTREQNNDLPVFRYADVLLLKAEAILRGANPTMGQTEITLANMVRTRSGANPYTSLTLDELLNERAREFTWEGWRRNDLIRFGKYENLWGVKTNSDVSKRIMPIPQTVLDNNLLLVQNPGYE